MNALFLADMLTRDDAVQFLENSWGINDVESQLKTDRDMFLNRLIRTMLEKVPLQLLSAFRDLSLILNNQKRMVYTIKEINEMCMSGLGGNCGVLNTFTWQILKVFGYSAHLFGGVIPSTIISTHLAVIVKDLVNPGDVHLVECGSGHAPTFKAISLNFNEESQIFQESFLEYKYIKHNDKLFRMHGRGDLVKRNDPPIEGVDFIIGKWRCFFEFSLEDFERKTLERFGDYFDVRCAPKNFPPEAAIYPGGKAIIIVGNNLFIEQEDKTLKKTKLTTDDEIMKAYQEYFPTIDENLVALAYSTWPKSRVKWR